MNILIKIIRKIIRESAWAFRRKKAASFDTRISYYVPIIRNSFLHINELDISKISPQTAKYLSDMYLAHRFDLLGSGWVKNSYDSKALGLENYKYNENILIDNFDKNGNWLEKILLKSHFKSSKKIWTLINDKNYIPIDWQEDFKSGYRWSSIIWYKDIKYGDLLGVDIKVPWELSRMQHLPKMAIFAKILPKYKNKLIKEFCNQILDFTATNPPQMGVNWTCPMDIAIRAVNMLMAYDMFCQIDNQELLDNKFKQIFVNSMYEHGKHIINNLEKGTSNHYLSDLAGLLFISAYLEKDNKTTKWFDFAKKEILKEFDKQFYPDGTNYEASTSYHRLSSEIIIYCLSLMTRLDIEFSENLQEKLFKSAEFVVNLTKPTDEIPQIGDNDNGRFINLSPTGEFYTNEEACRKYKNLLGYDKLFDKDELFFDENILNHSSLISAFDGLFDSDLFKPFSAACPLEKSFAKSLSKNKSFELFRHCQKRQNIGEATRKNKLKYNKQTIIKPEITKDLSLASNIKVFSYPDSGIYIFKSDRIHLTISAGPNGQNGNGGHAHNDKLSFELNIDGKDVIVDAGTYLYTPLPDKRNLFRNTKVHNTIIIKNQEQNDYIEGLYGLFNLKNQSLCKVLDVKNDKFIVELNYRDYSQVREFIIEEDKIILNDYSNKDFDVNLNKFNLYSNGYGKLINV